MNSTAQPNCLRYEDIKGGDSYSFTRIITAADIMSFAQLTGDHNPLHVDNAAAHQSPFGKNIAHGMLAGSLFSTLVGMHCPGRNALYLSQTLSFRSPIFPGDAITIKGTVREKNDSIRMITLKTEIINGDKVAVEGTAQVKVLDSGQEPQQADTQKNVHQIPRQRRIVLIVGGTGGIGSAIAVKCAEHEQDAIYVSYAQHEKKALELQKKWKNIVPMQCDLRSRESIKQMIESIVQREGKIDVLVNAAAASLKLQQFSQLKDEDIEEDIDVSLKGMVYACKYIMPHMTAGKSGIIINLVSSIVFQDTPTARMSSYTIAKYGVLGLTKAVAHEAKAVGVKVVGIAPSFVDTDFIKNLPPKLLEFEKEKSPSKRLLQSEDIAKVIIKIIENPDAYAAGEVIKIESAAR